MYFGSGDTNVYALNANTGKQKWKFKTGDVVHASPAISGGVLFVGSWDTYFYALDTATGKLKWRFKTGEDKQIYNQVGIQGSAAVSGGAVFFGCRDSNFYALDVKTGKKKWMYPNHGSWVITSPAVRDGKVYFSTADTATIHAVDQKTGKDVFTVKYKWPMFSSPAIAGNTLCIGSHEGKLLAIDLVTRKPAWEFHTDGYNENGAKYTDKSGGPDYAAAFYDGFYDSIVAGLQKMFATGAILSSPSIVDGVVYFGSADGNLYALE